MRKYKVSNTIYPKMVKCLYMACVWHVVDLPVFNVILGYILYITCQNWYIIEVNKLIGGLLNE